MRDLELDEPVTELGFVASCRVSPTGEAHLRLRLPTYFCALNFAFLMVADAHDAVDAVPGISGTRVTLVDHFAATEINRGSPPRPASSAFDDGLAQSELDQLRTTSCARRCWPAMGQGLPPTAGAPRRHLEELPG